MKEKEKEDGGGREDRKEREKENRGGREYRKEREKTEMLERIERRGR